MTSGSSTTSNPSFGSAASRSGLASPSLAAALAAIAALASLRSRSMLRARSSRRKTCRGERARVCCGFREKRYEVVAFGQQWIRPPFLAVGYLKYLVLFEGRRVPAVGKPLRLAPHARDSRIRFDIVAISRMRGDARVKARHVWARGELPKHQRGRKAKGGKRKADYFHKKGSH
jgi:hypothetical protein